MFERLALAKTNRPSLGISNPPCGLARPVVENVLGVADGGNSRAEARMGRARENEAMKMLKKAGIVTIGICSSKITGGTFCNVYGNDFIFAENPNSENLLFAGKRVSASVNKGQELPQDFGQASSIVDHGMIDGVFESRMEIREKITNLIRVLLKKSELEAKAESTSNVKVDLQSAS